MIIGIDIDGVLGDLIPCLCDFHNFEYQTDIKESDHNVYELNVVWNVTKEESHNRLWKFYGGEYFKKIKPISGSVNAINKIKDFHDLFIISARPNETYDETLRWLSFHFPKIFSNSKVYFTEEAIKKVDKNKTDICLGLNADLVIEDSLKYAESLVRLRLTQSKIAYPKPGEKLRIF